MNFGRHTPSGPKPVGSRRAELIARMNAARAARGIPRNRGGNRSGLQNLERMERRLEAREVVEVRRRRVVVARDDWFAFLCGRTA